MLAGLGPLLGEGALGSFVTPATSKTTPWYYARGEAFPEGRAVAVRVSTKPAKTLPHARVAVLVNENTTSSAEAVTVAFIGKENTTIIGQKTGGYSTANGDYELSDGAMLHISTAVYADRRGQQYDNGIIPDIVTAKETTLAKAVDWLLNQPK
jgi:C-terminal processing protease CtpA/Prc